MSRRGGYLGGNTLVPWHWFEPSDESRRIYKRKHLSRSGDTAFEKAVKRFLSDYAEAMVRNKRPPAYPVEVTERYQGASLLQWKKGILRTRMFKEAKAAARRKLK